MKKIIKQGQTSLWLKDSYHESIKTIDITYINESLVIDIDKMDAEKLIEELKEAFGL